MFWRKDKKTENGNNINETDLTITRYLTDGLLVFDKENRVFLANPQAEKILGIKEEQVLGRSI